MRLYVICFYMYIRLSASRIGRTFIHSCFAFFLLFYCCDPVPPDILVNESSSDMTMKEGDNTTLRCSAIGYPQPNVTWRREDYQPININQSIFIVDPFCNLCDTRSSMGQLLSSTGFLVDFTIGAGVVEGSVLNLVNVHRQQMAAYLCIGSYKNIKSLKN